MFYSFNGFSTGGGKEQSNYFLVVKQLKFSLNCDLFDPRCEGLDYKVDIIAHRSDYIHTKVSDQRKDSGCYSHV